MTGLQRLKATAYEKVWGTRHTDPWWPNPEQKKIGEVWFAAKAPLLVKFLFTSDNLSVQVHPGDDYALEHHDSPGKTEMWHVMRAEPGSQVALGLKDAVSEEELRAACLNGAVVDRLNWVKAEAGDTFFTPAGTIHAIGGGLTICEVQQVSDVTYRLYDWGREDRELHLDHGMRVSHLHAHSGDMPRELLVECDYFRVENLQVNGTRRCPGTMNDTIYVVLAGEGTIGDQPFIQGQAWEAAAGCDPFEIAAEYALILTAIAKNQPSSRTSTADRTITPVA